MPFGNSIQGLDSIRRGITGSTGATFEKTAQDIIDAIGKGEQIDFSEYFGDEEMTIDQFKDKVNELISSFPRDPSRSQDSFAIHITDEGFENMMGDKDYANWVLNKVMSDFATPDLKSDALGGAFDVKYFGAAISNYASDFWYAGTGDSQYNWSMFNNKSKNSFWQDINLNQQASQLMARAQAKQAQMAAQAAAAQWKAAQDAKK